MYFIEIEGKIHKHKRGGKKKKKDVAKPAEGESGANPEACSLPSLPAWRRNLLAVSSRERAAGSTSGVQDFSVMCPTTRVSPRLSKRKPSLHDQV